MWSERVTRALKATIRLSCSIAVAGGGVSLCLVHEGFYVRRFLTSLALALLPRLIVLECANPLLGKPSLSPLRDFVDSCPGTLLWTPPYFGHQELLPQQEAIKASRGRPPARISASSKKAPSGSYYTIVCAEARVSGSRFDEKGTLPDNSSTYRRWGIPGSVKRARENCRILVYKTFGRPHVVVAR